MSTKAISASTDDRPSITHPLSLSESRSLYSRLANIGARVFDPGEDRHFLTFSNEEVLAVAAEESRFQYRLLYVLVELMAGDYRRFHPFCLRDALNRKRTPQVWGIIREFSSKVGTDKDREAFFDILLREMKPASLQHYFISCRTPRPDEMRSVLRRTPSEFLKWGFASDEPPLSKELKIEAKPKTFDAGLRQQILERLLNEKPFVTVGDYLLALDFSISRQQAHRDLLNTPGVQTKGDRRGRRYSSTSARRESSRSRP